MICSRCNSERSYQFEATEVARSRPAKEDLPLVCRDCGLITINGQAVALPAELEKAASTMACAQDEAIRKAKTELQDCPDADRVDQYMSKFFKAAYLEGFFRALAFFKHNAKEGRLFRLRELWGMAKLTGSAVSTDENGFRTATGVCIEMPEATYTEFEQLLNLSAVPGDPDAKSDTNKRPTKQDNHSPLP
jgi:hypothetical protein